MFQKSRKLQVLQLRSCSMSVRRSGQMGFEWKPESSRNSLRSLRSGRACSLNIYIGQWMRSLTARPLFREDRWEEAAHPTWQQSALVCRYVYGYIYIAHFLLLLLLLLLGRILGESEEGEKRNARKRDTDRRCSWLLKVKQSVEDWTITYVLASAGLAG